MNRKTLEHMQRKHDSKQNQEKRTGRQTCSLAPCSLKAVWTSSCSSMAASASWARWRSISAAVRKVPSSPLGWFFTSSSSRFKRSNSGSPYTQRITFLPSLCRKFARVSPFDLTDEGHSGSHSLTVTGKHKQAEIISGKHSEA